MHPSPHVPALIGVFSVGEMLLPNGLVLAVSDDDGSGVILLDDPGSSEVLGQCVMFAHIAIPLSSRTRSAALWNATEIASPTSYVARIYAALEEIGWIDQEYLSNWDERQPDKEDPTAKQRQRRLRVRRRAEREAAMATGSTTGMSRPAKRARVPEPFDQRAPSTSSTALRMKRYRAQRRELGLPGCFKASQYRPALVARDHEQCIYCLAVSSLQVEHMFPVFQGGSDDLDNLGLACKLCNVRKGARTPEAAGMAIVVETAYRAYQRYKASPACADGVRRVQRVLERVRAERPEEGESNQSLGPVTAQKRDATTRLD
jgi:5-methylcytosine-specific restriction endonuclease McrA